MKKIIVMLSCACLFCACGTKSCQSDRGTDPSVVVTEDDEVFDDDTEDPAPYGALPSPQQVDWHKMEYYMFVHFGPNTFTDMEWGTGTEEPDIFNPTNLDCMQWAETAKKAGMSGIILTAKHHDGFCLWPSEYSTHTVRESKWRGGKGDVVKELSEACEKTGLKFGIYLSPWDQNHPTYGTPQYNQVFASTLSEIHGGKYGEIFEQWFDGAHGAGVKNDFYNWELFYTKVQPDAIIFSNAGPGCRWIGNEDAIAGETNWSTMNSAGRTASNFHDQEIMNRGEEGAKNWLPGESDISIRPGWFYSPGTDNYVKSLDKLVEIYYTSVGRNTNLLLNVPPDRTGRIHKNDSMRLMELRAELDRRFAENLAAGATATASSAHGDSPRFAASRATNGRYDAYWAAAEGVNEAWLEIDLGGEVSFDNVLLQEYIPLGQRVARFSMEYLATDGNWKDIDAGTTTTIGYKRILYFPEVTGSRLRINFEEFLAPPLINKVAVYNTGR